MTDLPRLIGGRYQPVAHIGTFGDGSPCDHPTATRYGDRCTCVVCGRCNRHTGNAHYGHMTSYCRTTKGQRESHFCCPDNCELDAA